MKVILTTTIKKLGKMGDKVSVKPGYARNFLFPNNIVPSLIYLGLKAIALS